ncbi:hypothetical protein IWW56_001232 [Coemansia sp. RSA 2131]|nr:hypothetical protein IWW56_001232 [Coemansia sp. RSA 2131]
MDRLPELVLQRVFWHIIDFRSLEYFEDPDYLGTWGVWADLILPLLAVNRYWRALSCPQYYQYAAGCFVDKPYNTIRPACKKARIASINHTHLRAMVRHVYLRVYLDDLLRNGLQRATSAIDGQFDNVAQLTVVVDETSPSSINGCESPVNDDVGADVPRRPIDHTLTSDTVRRINRASVRLRQMFPNARAIQVTGTSRTSHSMAITKLCCELLQTARALTIAPYSYEDSVAPMLAGDLVWVRVDLVQRCSYAIELVRRNVHSLQMIAFTNTRASFVPEILRSNDSANDTWLVYKELRELRLGLRTARTSDFEDMSVMYTAFPQLVRVAITPCDPQISAQLFGMHMDTLTSIRMFLDASTVAQLCHSGALDACEFPVLRILELHRPVFVSADDARRNGSTSMSRTDFVHFVCWVLRVGRVCTSIVMSGWRMHVDLDNVPEVRGLLTRVHLFVRRLELPVVCTVDQALSLARRFVHLSRFGVVLTAHPDDSASEITHLPYIRNLREFSMGVSCLPERQQLDIELACVFASKVPLLQRLVYHVEYADAHAQGLDAGVFELDLADSIIDKLHSERFKCFPHLDCIDVQCRGPDPHWL